MIIIIYYIRRDCKKNFALKYQIQKNFEWYDSISNSANIGLMRIASEKVTFVNDKLAEYILNSEKMMKILENGGNNNRDVILNTEQNQQAETYRDNEEFRMINLKNPGLLAMINSNLDNFLHVLLSTNPNDSYFNTAEDTKIYVSSESNTNLNGANLPNEERELRHPKHENILKTLKQKYNTQNDLQEMKLISLGNIKFEVKVKKDKENTPNQNTEGNLGMKTIRTILTRTETLPQYNSIENDTESITLEIIYRCYQEEDTKQDNYDFIFNDVTQATRQAEFKYQSLYFSKIAHEFKNPLITIIELAEKAKEALNLNELTDPLNLIQSYSNYMLYIAKDMNTFTSLKLNQNTEICRTKINLSEMLLFLTQLSHGLIARYNKYNKVQFVTSIEKMVYNCTLNTDETKLKQILINIISNGIKFTNEGVVSFNVSVNEEQKNIKFTISDTGRGMSESVKKKIFSPFFKTNKNNPLGTGLGMNIVQELTKLLNGNLQFDSVENIGTQFWFEIPLESITPTTSDQLPSSETLTNANHNDIIVFNRKLTKDKTFQPSKSNTSKELKYFKLPKTKVSSTTANEWKNNEHDQSFYSTTNTVKLEHFRPLLSQNQHPRIMELESIYSPARPRSSLKLDQFIDHFNDPNLNNESKSFVYISTKNTKEILTTINFNANNASEPPIKENCLHIIVADDEPLIRKSTIRVLQQVSLSENIPIKVYEATDGYEVLYLLTTLLPTYRKYDLILCDENMEYCGGLQCLKDINTMIHNHKLPNIPFYILSANYSQNSICNFCISKPLSNDIAGKILSTRAQECFSTVLS